MTQGDEMAEVTEGDREKAREVLRRIAVGTETTTVEIVAAALAEEREKARDEVYRELAELAGRQWYVTAEETE